MARYQVYLLDTNERIASSFSIIRHNDQAACAYARRMLDGTASKEAEVWIGNRCVGRVEAPPTPTCSSTE